MNTLERLQMFLRNKNVRAYLVGGTVRDLLLSRETRDLDLAVEGDAVALARAWADDEGAALYVMDAEHDVARVIFKTTGEHVDFARVRDGSIRADLATRDFTVNAIAANLPTRGAAITPEQCIDPFGGLADLEARQIRAVSDNVFRNDPVRLLRAVRIASELAFRIEPATAAGMRRDAPLIAQAAVERARDEFVKIMAQDRAAGLLRALDEFGILDCYLPEVAALKGVTQSAPHVFDVFEHSLWTVDAVVDIERGGFAAVGRGEFAQQLHAHFAAVLSSERPRGVLLRLAALWHDLGKPETRTVEEDGRVHFFGHPELGSEQVGDLARHLRFSNDEVEYFQTVVAGHLRPLLLADEGHPTKRAAYHLFRDAGIDGLDVLTLATADQRATYGDEPDPERVVRLQNLQSKFLAWFFDSRANLLPAPLVNGHDLMAMFDLAPGRGIGDLLDAIREAQVEGRVKTREDAFALAKNLLDRPVRSPKT